jgi:hypothetical protein
MRPRTLSEAYSFIQEMNLGPAGAGLQPVGKPVIMAVDIPADEFEYSTDEENEEVDLDEVELACAALYKLGEYAPKLLEIIKDDQRLDGWVASKITLASDYISEVYHRLDYISRNDCGCDHEPITKPKSVSTSTSMYMGGYEDNNN